MWGRSGVGGGVQFSLSPGHECGEEALRHAPPPLLLPRLWSRCARYQTLVLEKWLCHLGDTCDGCFGTGNTEGEWLRHVGSIPGRTKEKISYSTTEKLTDSVHKKQTEERENGKSSCDRIRVVDVEDRGRERPSLLERDTPLGALCPLQGGGRLYGCSRSPKIFTTSVRRHKIMRILITR